MARPLSWIDVRGGLIALALIALGAFGVLKFLRVGALRGDTIHVYARVGQATGLTPGSEVWLSGQKIGRISRIEFLPVASDTARRLLIEMQVLSEYLPAIHRDATAEIRTGGSLIGAVVVYLTPGTTHARMLAEGDTVAAKSSGRLDAARTELGAAADEVPAIMANVHSLVSEMKATRGTVGAALNGPGLRALSQTRVQSVRVMNRMNGDGTVGRIMRGGLTTRANRVLARVDSVRALLASRNTSLGRFRRDTTLVAEVADIRRELAEVQASLDESRGTAGRVLHDSAVGNALAGAQQEMTLLFADLKKHPLRYLPF